MRSSHEQRLEAEYKKIIHFFLENEFPHKDRIGLYTGIPGTILLLALDYLKYKDHANIGKINEGLEICLDYIRSHNNAYPILSGGIAGFNWIVDFLVKQDIIDQESEEILEVLDTFLISHINVLLEKEFSDLLNGAMGIGVYFMQRENFAPVEKIVDYLYQRKIEHGGQYLWTVDKKNLSDGLCFDFGLAHGAAGILYFLLRCIQLKICVPTCLELVEGILTFYEKNIQVYTSQNCFYPNYIEADLFLKNNYKPTHSRLAWCYGDLGVLHTLYNASLVVSDKRLEQNILDKLHVTSQRVALKDTQIVDAGFCHGTAGAAFLFWDLYLKTGNSQFSVMSDFWIGKTFEYDNNLEGSLPMYNFSTSSIKEEGGMCLNLLDGLAGVGLTYHFILNPTFPSDVKNILMLL